MDSCEIAEAALQEFLAAATVLPEQFGPRGPRVFYGERALMWAVFVDGIECYRRNAHPTSTQQRMDFAEAERWVWSTDWDWPFSFVNLCEVFGFDPARIRRELERWRERHNTLRRQRFRQGALRAA